MLIFNYVPSPVPSVPSPHLHEMLGLKPGASQEEVNQAYRDLVNVWHPDRFADNQRLQKKAEEKLKEINESYEYIKSFYRSK